MDVRFFVQSKVEKGRMSYKLQMRHNQGFDRNFLFFRRSACGIVNGQANQRGHGGQVF